MADGGGRRAEGSRDDVNRGSIEVDAVVEATSRESSDSEGVVAVEGSSCTEVILLPGYSCLKVVFKLFSVVPSGSPVTNSDLLAPCCSRDASSSSSSI